jgi:hypothetical protein
VADSFSTLKSAYSQNARTQKLDQWFRDEVFPMET